MNANSKNNLLSHVSQTEVNFEYTYPSLVYPTQVISFFVFFFFWGGSLKMLLDCSLLVIKYILEDGKVVVATGGSVEKTPRSPG